MWNILFYLLFCFSQLRQVFSKRSIAAEIISKREEILKQIVYSKPRNYPCSTTHFTKIEYVYGRSGNHFIQLVHGIWISDITRRTLIIPEFVFIDDRNNAFKATLGHFNLSVAKSQFCFIADDEVPRNAHIESLGVEEIFAIQDSIALRKGVAKRLDLPQYNNVTILEVSDYFIRFYAALWSNPTNKLRKKMISFINKRLHKDMGYISVHKRAMEGVCEKVVNVIDLSSYSNKELPMDDVTHWETYKTYHPLCQMPAPFVTATMALNNRPNRDIFVAYDGQGDCNDLEDIHAVFTKPMKGHARDQGSQHIGHLENTKWLDMGVAIHSDFFLQNPASTYSWMVFIVRSVLGLETVPSLNIEEVNNKYDFYLRFPYDKNVGIKWVSWQSIEVVAKGYRKMFIHNKTKDNIDNINMKIHARDELRR